MRKRDYANEKAKRFDGGNYRLPPFVLSIVIVGSLVFFGVKHLFYETMGAYHSTKAFEVFETGTNGTEISWEKFQEIWKLLKFQTASHSTENSGNSGMKVKWKGNFQEKCFENLGIPHEIVLFSGK